MDRLSQASMYLISKGNSMPDCMPVSLLPASFFLPPDGLLDDGLKF